MLAPAPKLKVGFGKLDTSDAGCPLRIGLGGSTVLPKILPVPVAAGMAKADLELLLLENMLLEAEAEFGVPKGVELGPCEAEKPWVADEELPNGEGLATAVDPD